MGLFRKERQITEFIDRLKQDYISELQLSEQMKQYAESARYKHVHEKLLYLSDLEKKQAGVIQEVLNQLGADIPKKIPHSTTTKNLNLFQALNRDLEMDNQNYFQYYDRLHNTEIGGFTGLLPTLNKLHENEAEHRKILRSILMRLNPHQV